MINKIFSLYLEVFPRKYIHQNNLHPVSMQRLERFWQNTSNCEDIYVFLSSM